MHNLMHCERRYRVQVHFWLVPFLQFTYLAQLNHKIRGRKDAINPLFMPEIFPYHIQQLLLHSHKLNQ